MTIKKFLSCLALVGLVACYPVQPDNGNTDNPGGTDTPGSTDTPGGGQGDVKSTVTVTSLSLSPKEIELFIDSPRRIPVHCTVDPPKAESGLVWTSSDPSIVRIIDDKLLVPEKLGSATITAHAANMSASCVVRVVEKTKGCVDMGVSVLWADCNLGASSPSEIGDYYAWGEVKPKDVEYYNWKHYNFARKDGANYTMTQYTTYDKRTKLKPEHDAAWFNRGGSWRMPTQEEASELVANCKSSFKTLNGVKGILLTSKVNGNTLFFPFTGYIESSNVTADLRYPGEVALIWTSSLETDSYCRSAANGLSTLNNVVLHSWSLRCCGLNVRPVFM